MLGFSRFELMESEILWEGEKPRQGSHSGEAAQRRLADGPEGVRSEMTNNPSLTAIFETRAEMLGFSRFELMETG